MNTEYEFLDISNIKLQNTHNANALSFCLRNFKVYKYEIKIKLINGKLTLIDKIK